MLSNSMFPAASGRRPKVAGRRQSGPAGDTTSASGKIHGFGPMTRVRTAFGEVHAHTLRERDRVRCKDGNFLSVVSIDRMTLDSDFLKYHPGAQPILIRAGALAQGIPSADIMLAPFQKIDDTQPFIAAKADKAIDAIHKPHVYRKSENMITYTVFRCERPTKVCSEGLWLDV